jgi:hypothetical protein
VITDGFQCLLQFSNGWGEVVGSGLHYMDPTSRHPQILV